MSKQIVTTWFFKSSRDDSTLYQTLAYTDHTLSCDCPGWKFKKKNTGGDRTCKHARLVEAGLAKEGSGQCVRRVDHRAFALAVERDPMIYTNNETGRKLDLSE